MRANIASHAKNMEFMTRDAGEFFFAEFPNFRDDAAKAIEPFHGLTEGIVRNICSEILLQSA